MKLKLLLLGLLISGITFAQSNPPLLDRALFFGNPEISYGQLSPNGHWITFMKAYNGILNIWIKSVNEPFEKARPLTDSKRPIYGYSWSYDSKYILYGKDENGDENVNIFAVNPNLPVAEGQLPPSKNLTPKKEVAAQIFLMSQKNPDILMIGLNDRDKAWHDLYQLTISTGELKKIYENTNRITGYNFDWDDRLRILSRTDEKGTTTLLRLDDGNKLTPIYKTVVTEQAYINHWNEDNSKCYLVSNVGELDLLTLFLMDPQSGALQKVESDPKGKVDMDAITVDHNTRKIISTSYTDVKTTYYWKDKTWEDNYKFLAHKFPGREITFQSNTLDYSKSLVAIWGDKYAPEAYLFDTKTKELIYQYTPRADLKKVEQYLAAMRPVKYKSSDGLEITGYLTLPYGKEAKNLPLVAYIHGGPKGARDFWGYNPDVQFLANRGYAVLQPNYRASGGYGKKFQNAGDLQWGKLMQDDITWGVKHLIDQGTVDKNKTAIMGASYGGYATLAGLAFTPDLYACGVDIVGPSNIFTLLESVPAYWEAGRAMLYGMTGDPNTEAGRQRMQEASPLFSADKIVKPLLIIQGANDPRVKKAEADQIVIALRDKGKKVNYLLADDEGHGFIKPINKMAMYAETEKFLAEVLGGRYQKEMPDDVSQRLNEMRVDISKVTYLAPQKITTASELPALHSQFTEGKDLYNVTIEAGGQKMQMNMTRTVSKKNNNWLIKDETQSAMGNSVDELELNAQFHPLSRKMEQGGQLIEMKFEKNKAMVNMMGKTSEIPLTGATIIEGPGSDIILGGLPLAQDYKFVFETPDIMTLKSKQMVLSYLGNETVNDINCIKLETANSDNAGEKTTYWIHPQTKKAEKIVSTLPALGNAVMTIIKK